MAFRFEIPDSIDQEDLDSAKKRYMKYGISHPEFSFSREVQFERKDTLDIVPHLEDVPARILDSSNFSNVKKTLENVNEYLDRRVILRNREEQYAIQATNDVISENPGYIVSSLKRNRFYRDGNPEKTTRTLDNYLLYPNHIEGEPGYDMLLLREIKTLETEGVCRVDALEKVKYMNK